MGYRNIVNKVHTLFQVLSNDINYVALFKIVMSCYNHKYNITIWVYVYAIIYMIFKYCLHSVLNSLHFTIFPIRYINFNYTHWTICHSLEIPRCLQHPREGALSGADGSLFFPICQARTRSPWCLWRPRRAPTPWRTSCTVRAMPAPASTATAHSGTARRPWASSDRGSVPSWWQQRSDSVSLPHLFFSPLYESTCAPCEPFGIVSLASQGCRSGSGHL